MEVGSFLFTVMYLERKERKELCCEMAILELKRMMFQSLYTWLVVLF